MFTTSPSGHNPLTTSPFATSKYDFYFRHYAFCGQWLRAHGFRGLQPPPPLFDMINQHTTPSTVPEQSPIPTGPSSPEVVQMVSPVPSLSLPVARVMPTLQPIKGPSSLLATAPEFFPSGNLKLNATSPELVVPKVPQLKPISTLPTIDEDYLQAMEVTRAHKAERDRFKYGTDGGSNWSSSGSNRKATGGSTSALVPSHHQIQYVDYCQVETYVTRSVAPSGGSKASSPPSGGSTTMTTTKKFVKRFQKNRKDRKVECWQEQVRDSELPDPMQSQQQAQSNHRSHKHSDRTQKGGGPRWRSGQHSPASNAAAGASGKSGHGSQYDRLYGPPSAMVEDIKARETGLQVGFDRFCDRTQPKLWPQLPVRLNFANQ